MQDIARLVMNSCLDGEYSQELATHVATLPSDQLALFFSQLQQRVFAMTFPGETSLEVFLQYMQHFVSLASAEAFQTSLLELLLNSMLSSVRKVQALARAVAEKLVSGDEGHRASFYRWAVSNPSREAVDLLSNLQPPLLPTLVEEIARAPTVQHLALLNECLARGVPIEPEGAVSLLELLSSPTVNESSSLLALVLHLTTLLLPSAGITQALLVRVFDACITAACINSPVCDLASCICQGPFSPTPRHLRVPVLRLLQTALELSPAFLVQQLQSLSCRSARTQLQPFLLSLPLYYVMPYIGDLPEPEPLTSMPTQGAFFAVESSALTTPSENQLFRRRLAAHRAAAQKEIDLLRSRVIKLTSQKEEVESQNHRIAGLNTMLSRLRGEMKVQSTHMAQLMAGTKDKEDRIRALSDENTKIRAANATLEGRASEASKWRSAALAAEAELTAAKEAAAREIPSVVVGEVVMGQLGLLESMGLQMESKDLQIADLQRKANEGKPPRSSPSRERLSVDLGSPRPRATSRAKTPFDG